MITLAIKIPNNLWTMKTLIIIILFSNNYFHQSLVISYYYFSLDELYTQLLNIYQPLNVEKISIPTSSSTLYQ